MQKQQEVRGPVLTSWLGLSLAAAPEPMALQARLNRPDIRYWTCRAGSIQTMYALRMEHKRGSPQAAGRATCQNSALSDGAENSARAMHVGLLVACILLVQ